MALAALAAGWNYGPFIVSPLAAPAEPRVDLSRGAGARPVRLFSCAGAMILALCPVFLFQAEQP